MTNNQLASYLRSKQSNLFATKTAEDFRLWSEDMLNAMPAEHRTAAWTLMGVTFNTATEAAAKVVEEEGA